MEEIKSNVQTDDEKVENHSDKSVESNLHDEAALEKDKMSSDNSDYDSADGEIYSEEEPNVKRRSKGSGSEEHSDSEAGSLTQERQEGDGQESVPSKKVDDDEDKKNPQYIPKRGTFYEHDDRTAEDGEEPEVVEEVSKEKDSKKQIWSESKERWSHDRFNETEQAPKSRTELVSIYGYDIRNEEGPPRARRRRRYGRGPNKYTRNWEDEDAYNKPQPTITRPKGQRRPRNDKEEFPPLMKDTQENIVEKESSTNRDSEVQQRKSEERQELPRENPVSHPAHHVEHKTNTHYQETLNNRNTQRIGSGRVSNPNGFTARTAYSKKFHREGQSSQPRIQKEDFIKSQNFTNRNNQEPSQNDMEGIEKGISKLAVDNENRSKSGSSGGQNNPNNNGNQRQGSMPPRLQNEPKGSKRYSSMRQRSLPETNNPPMAANYPTSFYPDNYVTPALPNVVPPLLHSNPQILPNQSQSIPPIPPSTLQSHPQQVPLQAAPFAQAYSQQPPPQFMQQPVVAGPPPQYMAPAQQTQLINYVQGQPSFAGSSSFPGYQGQFSPVVTPQTELYQPQGGITYYSTDQQMAQRQAPQKRPKAAIPIVAPPPYDESTSVNEAVELQQ